MSSGHGGWSHTSLGDIGLGPGEVLAHHSVDDAHHPPCQGDHDEFAGIALVPQAITLVGQGGLTSVDGVHRQVQRASHHGASAGDVALATMLAAIGIIGRKPGDGGDLTPGQLPQLGR